VLFYKLRHHRPLNFFPYSPLFRSVPAFAVPAVCVDRDVPELARDVGDAMVDLAVDDDAAADTGPQREPDDVLRALRGAAQGAKRSEEHTSELQSLRHLVCRLLLEK